MILASVCKTDEGAPGVRLMFAYDPSLIAAVKAVSGRRFHPGAGAPQNPLYKPLKCCVAGSCPPRGSWVLPYSLETWQGFVKQVGAPWVSETEELKALVASEQARSASNDEFRALLKVRDAKVDLDGYEFATSPFAHQRVGLRFLIENKRAGLLWQPGTGKTKCVIDDVRYRKQRKLVLPGPVIVICPNEVKEQWLTQVPQHSGGELTAIAPEGSTVKRAEILLSTTADFVVLNVESVIYLKEALLSREWAYVVYDEATRFKNNQALRTKVALKIKCDIARILTGTPITNSPIDVYCPFSLLDRNLFGSWFTFSDRYLIKGGYDNREVVAFKNMDELQAKVFRYSTRVLKDECLDLPPKLPPQPVNIELKGETLDYYERMRDEAKIEWESAKGSGSASADLAITLRLRLNQIAGGLLQQGETFKIIPDNPKLKALEQLVEDLGPDAKIVVFAVYREQISHLIEHFSAWHPKGMVPAELAQWPALNPVAIYGKVNLAERTIAWKEKFQKGDSRMIICQIHSGGIGIDLYASQTAVFYTRNDSLEDFIQAGDRLHRIGQKGTVSQLVFTAKLPIVRGKRAVSIDDSITVNLDTKQAFADQVTGDKTIVKSPQQLLEEVL